ncbi:PREDICTED: cytochrome P450 6k1-like isoform X2 [Dinoponera quadriceps]|uniref:Cytochrome P450 6k1-like isoform X2 n=1 Tax=Dinoponera quadriceps TaxID=609295 RepID=A0A6P3XUD4_DINQU|nr:PREDICTED: cytochrome P450 6k1-like isoform X2 [Dinoponera quadriceps]
MHKEEIEVKDVYTNVKMIAIMNYRIMDGVIFLTITIAAATYFYMTRNFNYWKKRGVFEIKPVPFFGNFMHYVFQRQSPIIVIKDLYNRAKGHPYVGFYVLDKPCILLRDREVTKDILVKNFNYFCNRNSTAKDRMSRSTLFFLKNPNWKILRSKLRPILSSGKLKMMFNLLLECSVNLDTYLDSTLDGKGKIIDVRELLGNVTTDMICSTAFGLNVNSVQNPECVLRKNGKAMFDYDIYRGFEMFQIFFYPNLSRLFSTNFFSEKGASILRDMFWDTMNYRIKSGQKRGDLIDSIIDYKRYFADNMKDFDLEGDDIVAQAAIFFAGGFETSSSAMSFTMYELALQQEIQDRLRKEILDTLDKTDGQITYEMIQSMSYLDMVVSETLRKYPILGVIDRETVEPYKIPNSNLVLEKGMPVFISIKGLHYDPEYFPNPEKFDPERFSEENKRNIQPFTYMPFGEGPRMCIGMRLGILQVKLGLLKALYRYKVTPCEKTIIPMVLEPKSPITTPFDNTIYLTIQKINTNN